MWCVWVALAGAGVASAAEPFPAAADPEPLSVSAYSLPPQDPAWLTDDAPLRHCRVRVTAAAAAALVAEPIACAEPMVDDFITASEAWVVEGVGSFEIAYQIKYNAIVQAMTVHAQVDPGLEAAEAGLRGPPGVKLVHPAVITRRVDEVKLPGKAKKEGISGAICRLHLWVDDLGRVAQLQVLECPEVLHKSVEKSGKKWRLTPRYVDGTPVPAELMEDVRVGDPPAP